MPFKSLVRKLLPCPCWRIAAPLALLFAVGCDEVPTEALRFLQLEIEAPTTTLVVGETVNFGVSAVSSAGARLELVGLNWRSSDPSIATIEDGRVSGLGAGSTFVHAHIAGISDSLFVTVHAAQDRAAPPSRARLSGCWDSRGPPLGPTTIC